MSIDEIRARVHDREQRAAQDGSPPVHRMVVPAEMRADQSPDGGADLPIVFTGHAAVFDRLSHDLGGFRERVKRGAFRKVLDASADVLALVNHDPSMVLARTRPGTLQLREDPRGLHAYIDAADTTYARDLRELVRRGDVDSMSFGFTVQADEWAQKDGEVIRTITEIGDLLDVSVVTLPAYPQTDVSARAAGGVVPGEELPTDGTADEGTPPPEPSPVMGAEEAARGLGTAWLRRRLRMRELGVPSARIAQIEERDIASIQDRVTPRQRALYEALESLVGVFGPFDQTTGADGAHYVDGDRNPFSSDGLACRNCAFFVGGGGCEVVSGVIDPDAVCKLWVIPQDIIAGASAPRPTMSPGG